MKKRLSSLSLGIPAVALLTFASSASIWAASLYVDSTKGKDGGDGSQGAPFQTIAYALAKAQPGDTVALVPGQPPICEGVRLDNRSGNEGAPITIDGGGNTLTGSRPLDIAAWEEVKPSLYRHKMTLFADATGKMSRSMLGRYFFVMEGSINRMGRSSKNGTGVKLKQVEELQPGEWTFVDSENAFYIATAPNQKLADARVEAPVHLNGVGTSGSVAHLVVKNLNVTHFLNDGFNFHGASRDVLIQECSATECGDDGMSAHGDCRVAVKGFVAQCNSTGICHINESCSINEDVVLLNNVGVNLYLLGSGTHTFKKLQTTAPIWLGKPQETLAVSFTDCFEANSSGKGGVTQADFKIGEGVKVEFLGATQVGQ